MTGTVKTRSISEVVIAGGGFTGWYVALRLATALHRRIRIRLIEADDQARMPITECLSPGFSDFHRLINRSDSDLLRQSHGTYALASQWTGLLPNEDVCWLPYAEPALTPITLDATPSSLDIWIRLKLEGHAAALEQVSLPMAVAAAKKMAVLETEELSESRLTYGFQVDATLYARALKKLAIHAGVNLIEGVILERELRSEDGHIRSLILDGGRQISGDLYVDCTDTRALLADDFVNMPWQDWSHWLPTNRMLLAPTERMNEITPYSTVRAHRAGTYSKVPLQYRSANAFLYSDAFMDDTDAESTFAMMMGELPLSVIRQNRYKNGARLEPWTGNVIAIGKAAVHIDPIAGRHADLLRQSTELLLRFFPDTAIPMVDCQQYNKEVTALHEQARDYLIATLHLNHRHAEPYWQYLSGMRLPDSLALRYQCFKSRGRALIEPQSLISAQQWQYLWLGLQQLPESADPLIRIFSDKECTDWLQKQTKAIAQLLSQYQSHETAIQKNCRA